MLWLLFNLNLQHLVPPCVSDWILWCSHHRNDNLRNGWKESKSFPIQSYLEITYSFRKVFGHQEDQIQRHILVLTRGKSLQEKNGKVSNFGMMQTFTTGTDQWVYVCRVVWFKLGRLNKGNTKIMQIKYDQCKSWVFENFSFFKYNSNQISVFLTPQTNWRISSKKNSFSIWQQWVRQRNQQKTRIPQRPRKKKVTHLFSFRSIEFFPSIFWEIANF